MNADALFLGTPSMQMKLWQATKGYFMTDAERLASIRAKLAARRGMPGFEDNVQALEREIAALEQKV